MGCTIMCTMHVQQAAKWMQVPVAHHVRHIYMPPAELLVNGVGLELIMAETSDGD